MDFRMKSESKKQTACALIIPFVFLALLYHIVSVYNQSGESLTRIAKTKGPLSQFLPIYSGEIHYARIPNEYWRHRIQMVKAMGFNSLTVAVMWNAHEIEKGIFDF